MTAVLYKWEGHQTPGDFIRVFSVLLVAPVSALNIHYIVACIIYLTRKQTAHIPNLVMVCKESPSLMAHGASVIKAHQFL